MQPKGSGHVISEEIEGNTLEIVRSVTHIVPCIIHRIDVTWIDKHGEKHEEEGDDKEIRKDVGTDKRVRLAVSPRETPLCF